MLLEALAFGSTAAAGTISLGIFHPRFPLFGPVVWHGRRDAPQVALSFDDGPHPSFSRSIAEALKSVESHATFFSVGKRLEEHPEVAEELVSAGHELANHTYSHGVGRDLFSASRLKADIARCQTLLCRFVAQPPMFYRPAVGIRNPLVHQAARELGLSVVTWADAARDGAFPLTEKRALAIARRAQNGDILTLHDGITHGKQVPIREATVRHLPVLLAELKNRGFKITTVTGVLAART